MNLSWSYSTERRRQMPAYASVKPPGAPDCWGDNWNPEDDVCANVCGFDGSCGVRYRKIYGDPHEDDYEPSTPSGRVAVVRRGRGRVVTTSSSSHSRGQALARSRVSDGHPIIPEEEQENISLMHKVFHNTKVGMARAALDEVYDVFLRSLLKIPKF
jgi:hypothetical protein